MSSVFDSTLAKLGTLATRGNPFGTATGFLIDREKEKKKSKKITDVLPQNNTANQPVNTVNTGTGFLNQ